MTSKLAANTERLDRNGSVLVSKGSKVSNEVSKLREKAGVCYQPRKRKAKFPGSTAKISYFGPGRWIVTCSQLFLTRRFSLGRRVFSAVPA